MTAPAKFDPPKGRMPVLQFMPPAELAIDAAYQRSIDGEASQALIRKIAARWNWDLCQPLVVSRRGGAASSSGAVGEQELLFVIDGQHRLAAARLRGDIAQLPCAVVEYASAAAEAASFVDLNQQRRPLGKLDLFKAALASEDAEAVAILGAMQAAGLSVAPHSNYTAWKPGMVSNIGGIQAAWRKHGPAATGAALRVLAKGFAGQVLQYAGTIFPGVVAVCAAEGDALDERLLAHMAGSDGQRTWRKRIMDRNAADPNLKFAAASAAVFTEAWQRLRAGPQASPPGAVQAPAPHPVERVVPAAAQSGLDRYDLREKGGARWCEQCEKLRTAEQARGCESRFCKLGVAA